MCVACAFFFGDTNASLTNYLVHCYKISLYSGDSRNANSFVHCAGEAVEYLQYIYCSLGFSDLESARGKILSTSSNNNSVPPVYISVNSSHNR